MGATCFCHQRRPCNTPYRREALLGSSITATAAQNKSGLQDKSGNPSPVCRKEPIGSHQASRQATVSRHSIQLLSFDAVRQHDQSSSESTVCFDARFDVGRPFSQRHCIPRIRQLQRINLPPAHRRQSQPANRHAPLCPSVPSRLGHASQS